MLGRPLWVCAVQRRRFSVGANPIRQPLQPEAIAMAMVRWLLPVPVPPIRTTLRCSAMNAPPARSRTSVSLTGVPVPPQQDLQWHHDHIVPYDAAKPLIAKIGSADKQEVILKGRSR